MRKLKMLFNLGYISVCLFATGIIFMQILQLIEGLL